jgi:hypothetical protein
MVSIPPPVRDLRADLARRPTMTELFHRGYNPRTLPPEFTTWFDFVAAEGDATALEAECLGRFRDWFVMLATTRMTKSFKMVLLRVLLDNDAVFAGMPIPELAAKCREFLVAHELLRRDIADAATGQPVVMSPRKWESSWRKFPISTTAMPCYDAIDLAWAISSCCTARTCSARSVATAIVSPSSVMNSTSYPLPSSCTSTTVPMSPAARPWSGRSHVSTTSSSSSIT